MQSNEIQRFAFVPTQREVQNSIGIIAKEILHRREKNTDYSELEEQLNGLVEALYQ